MKNIPKESIRLLRDVDAYMVPSGDEVKLLAGNLVQITQALGGNYTVLMNGNMVQISAENADALDLEIPEETLNKPKGDLEQQIWDQLKTCYDPEIPVNIVELGLIYDVFVNEDNDVKVIMTLTTPNCPVAESMPLEVEEKVKSINEVNNAKVELTFEPAWTKDLMSEEAKLELGFL